MKLIKTEVYRLKLITLLIVLFTFNSTCLKAQIFTSDTGHAEVKGKAPIGSYTGVTDELSGRINLNNNRIKFQVALKSIKTGNKKRDKHMYKALNVSEYPNAQFEGKLVSNFDTSSLQAQEIEVEGDFSIHGETRHLKITGTLEKTEEGLKYKASWPINITDYNIKRPSFLFFKVKNKHQISIHGVLKNSEV